MENNYLKNKAYKLALKYTTSEEEVIYAKLEKQGIPVDLAKEVAMNVVLERGKHQKEDFSDLKKAGLLISVFWVLISITTYVVTGGIFDAIGLLIVGVSSTLLMYAMTTSK